DRPPMEKLRARRRGQMNLERPFGGGGGGEAGEPDSVAIDDDVVVELSAIKVNRYFKLTHVFSLLLRANVIFGNEIRGTGCTLIKSLNLPELDCGVQRADELIKEFYSSMSKL
ncbi:hypothetical protein Tco_0694130, partial [Tanacetum coccineum]